MFPIFLWVEEYKGLKDFQLNLDNEYSCEVYTEIYKDMPRKKEKKVIN